MDFFKTYLWSSEFTEDFLTFLDSLECGYHKKVKKISVNSDGHYYLEKKFENQNLETLKKYFFQNSFF